MAIVGVGVYVYSGDVGHTSDQIDETDTTVLASVKDGVSWSELSGIPSGFADGVDDTGEGGAEICPAGTLEYVDNEEADIYHSHVERYSSAYSCPETVSKDCRDVYYLSPYYYPRQIECRIDLSPVCKDRLII